MLARIFVRRQSTIAALLAAPKFRAALVRQVDLHPDADSLYVSKIDTGESELTVVSGLRKYISRNELEGSKVVLVTNLKPSKLRGITSEAMVLAATSADQTQLELVQPPSTSRIGDYLSFEGAVGESKKSMKSKLWRDVQSLLSTNRVCEVIATDNTSSKIFKLVSESKDVCRVESIVDGPVS